MAKSFNSIKAGWKNTNNEKNNKTNGTKKEFKDIKSSEYDFGHIKSQLENDIRLTTFQSDLSSMGKTIEDSFTTWQSPETMEMNRSAVGVMKDRINKYQEYQRLFGGADLSDLASGYQSILDDWDDRTKTYGKYKSADEYDNAMKLAKAELEKRESMKTANLDEVQAEIDRLKGMKDSDYFEEVKRYEQARRGAKQASEKNGYVYDYNTSPIEKKYKTAVENLNKFLAENGYENQEAFQKALDEKTNYLNQAKVVQENIRLTEDIRKDANYEKYASAGEALGNEKADGWFVPDNQRKNSVAYLRNNPDALKAYEEAAKSANGLSFGTVERQLTEGNLEYKLAKYGTDEQLKDYYAYLGKGDEENALKYLKSIELSLNETMGTEIADDRDSTWKQLSFMMPAGLGQFEQGTKNLFNRTDDYIPPSPTQIASGQVRENLDDVWYDDVLGVSLGQVAYDLGTTTFNMAPSILASSVSNMILPGSGAVIGGVTMGMSAAGGAYQEKLNQGWDKDQARVYSTAIGISEGALQYALGGISSMGGKLSGKSIQAMATGIDNGLARFFATMGIKGASEGIEESLQEIIAPFIENLALGYAKNDWSDVELAEVAYAGILGALSAGLLEGGGTAVTVYKENSASKGLGKTVRATEKSADVFNMASLTPQESDAYNLYTQYAKKGVNAENASDLQLGRLAYNTENVSRDVSESRKASPVEKLNAKVALRQIENIKKDEAYKNRAKELSAETKDKKPLEEGVNIQGIKLGEDTKLVTDNGEVSLDEVALPERQAEIIARAESMHENVANVFITQYDGETDVDKYHNSFNLAVEYSKNAFPQETILKNKGVLSERQVAEIYEATRIAVVQENQKAIDNITAKHSKGTFLKGTFNDSVIDYTNSTTDGSKVNWNSLTSKQRSAIKFTKMFSKATGVNVRFIQSKVVDGKRVGKNGSYDPDTNTIEVDIYAGIDGQYVSDAIIPTLSHELTHWMKAKSPAIYERIKNELVPFIAEKQGMTIERLVDKEIIRIKEKHPELNVSEEYAMDELVARACEDMLSNSNQAKSLLAKMTYAERNSFVGKIQTTLKNLIEWADELLSRYKSESEEAKLLREYKAKLKKVSKMWDEMLVESIETNQALQKEGKTGEQLANANAEVQLSIREIVGESGTNYGIGVYLDDNLLTGLTEDERKQMVKEYVVSELAGNHFVAYDGNVPVEIGIAKKNATIKKKNGKDRTVVEELYRKNINKVIKQEAVVLADELIKTAKYKNSLPSFYSHDWVDNYGKNNWDYWKVFIQEKNKTVWEATLNIANTKNGKKILYDIDPIKKVEDSVKSVSNSTKGIITQEDAQSQEKFSDRGNGYVKAQEMQTEINQLTNQIRDIESSDGYKSMMDALSDAIANDNVEQGMAEYNKWLDESGYGKLRERRDSLREEFNQLQKDLKLERERKALDEEQQAIAKSGLSEADYFRKQAIKEFGYTPFFYDAGYITPNGKMLNFSGEKGQHYGTRGQDHRAIGIVYANTEGSKAMVRFMGDGNIRIMAESPGIDISSIVEPTKEQYATIRKFVREYANKEYFNIDITNAEGQTVGNYEYEGRISAERVVNDIKYFFENGTTREQSSISQFHYSDRDSAYLEAVEKGDVETASRMVEEAAEKAFSNSKVRGSDGKLRLVYHGTVNEFTVFNRQFSNIEGDFGKGYYFTSNEYDVDANYANEDGPDLKNKIARYAEKLEYEDEYADLSYEERKEIARQKFITSEPNTITAYLNMENPVYITSDEQGTFLDYNEEYDEEYDEYGEPEGLLVDFIEALADNARDYESYRDVDFSFLYEYAMDGGVYASDVVKTIKHRVVDELVDENGDLAINEVIRLAFEQIGFDGIIDTSVYYKFRNMDGMDSGTTHYIVFDSEQIKSADIATYDNDGNVIPLSQRFDENNKDIRYSDRDSEGNTLTEAQQEFFKDSKVRDAEGNLLVVYHGSPKSFTIFDTHKDTSSIIYDASFFTSDEARAKAYANKNNTTGNLYKGYVNITKPLMPSKVKEQISLIPDSVKEQYRSEFDVEDMVSKTDYAIIDFAKYVARKENSTMATVLKKWGFDGYINGKDYAIFEPEQFKAVDNTNPTTDPDMYFSDRMTESVYDKMGEAEQLRKDNERLTKDLGKLKERLSIEGKVTGGTAVLTKDTDLIAGRIRKLADSTYDKDALSNDLKEFYTYMRESSLKGTWNEDAIFAKAKELAETVLSEAKPKTVSNDYAKFLLREIRSKRISLSETQVQEAKNAFGKDWRNAFWGKVTIANNGVSLDSQWQEWHSLYPEFFEADVNEGDQITALLELYNDLRDVSEVVQEYNAEEQTRWLAEEILDKCWELPVRFTIADKYDARIKVLKFEHRQAMKEVREDYETKLKEQHKVDKAQYRELVQKVRDRKDAEIAEAKKLGKERLDEYKENAERKTVMQSILSKTTSLSKKLMTNDKDVHIPEDLKPVVTKIIDTIDFSSRTLLGLKGTRKDYRGMPTKTDRVLENRFERVRAMADENVSLYDAISEALKLFQQGEGIMSAKTEGIPDVGLAILDADLLKDLEDLKDDAHSLEKKFGEKFVLQEMSLKDLKTLNSMVHSINHWAIEADKMRSMTRIKSLREFALKTVAEDTKMKEYTEYIQGIESVRKFLAWDNLQPAQAFDRLGETGKEMYNALLDAMERQAFNEDEIEVFTKELLDGHDVDKWRTETKTFELELWNGEKKTVEMPISFVMSLYCVSKQADAKRHLFAIDGEGNRYNDGGGMTIAPYTDKGKKGIKGVLESVKVKKDIKNTVLVQKNIDQITKVLTKEQRDIADAMQKFMNETGSKWGNMVSEVLYGIKKFGIEDYFPITVSPTTLKQMRADGKEGMHFFSILNYGFTKSRNPDARQSIEIGDIFDVFAKHMKMMAIYNAWAIPVYDMVRWFNFTGKDMNGNEIGVNKSIQEAFGKGAVNYITTLIEDLNGQHESSRLGFIQKIISNTKIALVGNSLSVALLQPTAIVKAFNYISPKYVTKSLLYIKDFGVKRGRARAKEHNGIALLKSKGRFEMGVSIDETRRLLNQRTFWDKRKENSLKGAGLGDDLTLGLLWNACEFETKEKRKDLRVGSDEYFKVVSDRLREIVVRTQVVDTPLTKSHLMRSADSGAKSITMFASEITSSYNLLTEAFYQASIDKKKYGKEGSFKRNIGNISRAVAVHTLTSAVVAVFNTFMDNFRNDDDEEKELEDYLKQWFSNFLVEVNLLGKIPYVKDIVSNAQGFTSTRTETLWMESAVKTVQYAQKAFDGKEGSAEKSLVNFLKVLSDLNGLPIYNQYRELVATLDFFDILDDEDIKAMYDELFN